MKAPREFSKRFETGALVGAGLVIAILVASATVTNRDIKRLYDDTALVAHTQEVFNSLDRVMSLVKDGETGQRGYLITGETRYLEPYESAIVLLPPEINRLATLTADNPDHQAAMPKLRELVESRIEKLKEVKELREEQGFEAARQVPVMDRGKELMDALRAHIAQMADYEHSLMAERSQQSTRSFQRALTTSLVSLAVALASVAAFIALVNRNLRNKTQAAALLHHEREKFEVTLSSIGDGVIATDTEGRVSFLNQVAESLTGWKPAEALNQPLEEVFDIVNETTRLKVENPAIRALEVGKIVGLANHTSLIHRNGSERAIADSAAPIRGLDGELLGAVLVFRDVDEERTFERALVASEARKTAILNTALDCIITCDHEGRVVEFNPAAERTFGYRRDEILGHELAELIVPPKFRDQHRQGMLRHLESGESNILNQRLELPGMRADGSEFPAELAITRIPGAGPAMFTAYLRDITERKQAEKTLAQRMNLLALTAEVSKSLAIGETSSEMLQGCAEALVKHLDAALARIWLFNAEANALELRASAGLFTQIDSPHPVIPLGKLKVGMIAETRAPHLTNSVIGDPQIVDQLWASQNGLVSFAGYPLIIEEQLVGVMAVFARHALMEDTIQIMESVGREVAVAIDRQRAIRAVQEAEEQFRLLAETIPQLAWMTGPDGTIEWYNQRWYDYTGKTPEEMLGWGWQSVHDPNELPRVMTRFQAAISTGEPWEDTFPLRRFDGVFRWHLSRAHPLRDTNGEIVHWFGTNTDITEERELAENLRAVAAELSEANRRKNEFLATLAHELRNPLAPIRTGLELMKLAANDPTIVAEARGMMERQALQMVRLIDDLLDVSRITQGKLQLRKSRVELAEVVRNSVEASRPLISEAGHELTIDVPQEPISLYADPSRLAQVISNLLNNAAKYTPHGGRIWLNVRRERNEVAIRVKDTGMGIPAEMQKRVFEMFAQIDRPLERGNTGLGIGLTLVKRIVEMHDGTIEIHSAGEHQGSEFTVRLPLFEEAESAATNDSGLASAAAALPPSKIIVVDDNRDAAETLRAVLSIMGHEIRVVHDGVEAVEAAELFQPDLVVMDLGMPRLNGFEAAKRIRQQPWGNEMVLIALTGWGQTDDRERSKAAGFDYHLTKAADPTALEQLLGTIAKKRTES